jgi:hypothetical protein
MRLFRWSTILLMVLVSGCALFRPDPAKKLEKLTTAFRDEAAANGRLDPIRGKVSFIDAREATPSMLALTTFPTDAEKRALEEWQGTSRYWQLRVTQQLPKTSAWTIPILEASRAASLTLLARLHEAGIDYGQFNKERIELAARTEETVQARAEELKAGTGSQSPAASAAISAFQNALLKQRLVDQRMQPIRAVAFPCTRSGRKANCY